MAVSKVSTLQQLNHSHSLQGRDDDFYISLRMNFPFRSLDLLEDAPWFMLSLIIECDSTPSGCSSQSSVHVTEHQ